MSRALFCAFKLAGLTVSHLAGSILPFNLPGVPVHHDWLGMTGYEGSLGRQIGGGQIGENYASVCSYIVNETSSSSTVHYPGSGPFRVLSSHWASTSNQLSACVLEPGSATDIGKILDIVGRTGTPFAIQSGGHATNPGFSSTKGVHISMNRFRSVDYDASSQTVEFGTGLKWEQVYAELEPHGVSVLGGRVSGVGVGGFTLGGGYSWRANQHGLSIDTVTAFELVKPSGEVAKVTESSDPQLFFGLKGGSNNFGVVTKITMKTFDQGLVWGGQMMFIKKRSFDAVGKAMVRFSAEVTDTKAAMYGSIGYLSGMPLLIVQLFYDGPTPPPGIFDDFLAISSFQNTVGTQSYLSLVKGPPANTTYGLRGQFQGIPVPEYSPDFVNLLLNLSVSLGDELMDKSLVYLSFAVEPFLPSILSHNTSPSAYPYDRSKAYTPFNIFMSWSDPAQDEFFRQVIVRTEATLYKALEAEGHTGLDTAPLYPNYAIKGTPSERVYGSNFQALKELKARVDPLNIMGLAGGFKI